MLQVSAVTSGLALVQSLTTSATERGYQAALQGDQAGEAIVRAKLAQYVGAAFVPQLSTVAGGRAIAGELATLGPKAFIAKYAKPGVPLALAYVNNYAGWLGKIYTAWDAMAGAGASTPALNVGSTAQPAVQVSGAAQTSGGLTADALGLAGASGLPSWVLIAGALVVVVLVLRGSV